MKNPLIPLLLAAALLPVAAQADVAPEKLYEKHCAKCHGDKGRADTWRGRLTFAQDFSKDSFQQNRTDDEILDKINRGPRIMPSYADVLSRNERLGLVKLIRGFAKEPGR
ncbi:MAG: c-type cytochrome [Gammaproteobacteria bacterium]